MAAERLPVYFNVRSRVASIRSYWLKNQGNSNVIMAMARATLPFKNAKIFDFDVDSPGQKKYGRSRFPKNTATQTAKKGPHFWRGVCFLFILIAISSFLYAIFFTENNVVQFLGRRCRQLVLSSAYGVGTTVFVWMITYLDSEKPGINPPTPITPTHDGKLVYCSSYQFHFNYVLAIFVGIAVFLITLMDL